MHNMDRWVTAYVGMDDRRRQEMLMFAEDTAATYPHKKPVRLSLVANNGPRVSIRLKLGEPSNALAPIGVGKVVELK